MHLEHRRRRGPQENSRLTDASAVNNATKGIGIWGRSMPGQRYVENDVCLNLLLSQLHDVMRRVGPRSVVDESDEHKPAYTDRLPLQLLLLYRQAVSSQNGKSISHMEKW
jgi:hypothetical protein